MTTAFVVIFWAWTAISIAILATRGVRRRRGRVSAQQMITNLKAKPQDVITPSDRAADMAAPSYTAIGPVRAFASLPAGPPSPVRAGGFAGELESAAAKASARLTVADVLAGVALPHDLAPLTGWNIADVREGARAVFVAQHVAPEAVGCDLADELERRGMEVRSITDDTALARRGNDAVKIQIFVTGGVAHPLFPTAPLNSVIVQFDVA